MQWVKTSVLYTYTTKEVEGAVTENTETATDLGTDVLWEYCSGR